MHSSFRFGLRVVIKAFVGALALSVLGLFLFDRWYMYAMVRTAYASGYDEQVFDSLQLGLAPAEVISKLGPPLYIVEQLKSFAGQTRLYPADAEFKAIVSGHATLSSDLDDLTFWYSDQVDQRKDYDVRALAFDGSGKLTSIDAGLYTD